MPPVEQEPTDPVTIEEIMASRAFALGVQDVRARRPPRDTDGCDDVDTVWNYERGRAWALLAPPNMPLRLPGGALNPSAVRLYAQHDEIL
jgi:hypothetical protein